MAIKMYNSIPIQFKSLTTDTFKNNANTILINECIYDNDAFLQYIVIHI